MFNNYRGSTKVTNLLSTKLNAMLGVFLCVYITYIYMHRNTAPPMRRAQQQLNRIHQRNRSQYVLFINTQRHVLCIFYIYIYIYCALYNMD